MDSKNKLWNDAADAVPKIPVVSPAPAVAPTALPVPTFGAASFQSPEPNPQVGNKRKFRKNPEDKEKETVKADVKELSPLLKVLLDQYTNTNVGAQILLDQYMNTQYQTNANVAEKKKSLMASPIAQAIKAAYLSQRNEGKISVQKRVATLSLLYSIEPTVKLTNDDLSSLIYPDGEHVVGSVELSS